MSATGFVVESITPGTYFDQFRSQFKTNKEFEIFCLNTIYDGLMIYRGHNYYCIDRDEFATAEKFRALKTISAKKKNIVAVLNNMYYQIEMFRNEDEDNMMLFDNMSQNEWLIGLIEDVRVGFGSKARTERQICLDIAMVCEYHPNNYMTYESKSELVVTKPSPFSFFEITTEDDETIEVKCFEYMLECGCKGWERL